MKEMMDKILAHARGALKSWTIWFNGLVGTALLTATSLQDFVPQLADFLTPDMHRQLVLIVLVANIVLRIKTNKGLDQK